MESTPAPLGASVHVPILVEPIVRFLVEPFRALAPDAPAHDLIDCTLGGGGHTAAFLAAFAADPKLAHHRVVSVDQDAQAIARARQRFGAEIQAGRLHLLHGRFSELPEFLASAPDRRPLGLLADLGFSSDQLEDAARGLSFQSDGPLDMRLNPECGVSAYEFLAQAGEAEIADTLFELAEERFSRRIASSIVRARQDKRLPTTTRGLAELVVRAVPASARHGRIHAATRTFQALRIHVNDELIELDHLLERVILSIRPQGRIAILSFHSLEDRKVKQAFRNSNSFEPLTKKPIVADEAEVRNNPRARSAKLRVAYRRPATLVEGE